MKHTNRNMFIALGLVASLALPGMALADNWQQPSLKYSAKQHHRAQRHDAHRGHDRNRYHDRYAAHEWREHHRRHRIDRDDYYRVHEWREHEARRYYRLHRNYSYGVLPSAFVSGIYVAPTPTLVIELR